MRKMKELQNKIKQKQRELDKLQTEQSQLESLGPEYSLAVELHYKLCHDNHADGCSWHYEIKDNEHVWTRSAHEQYLEKARRLLAVEPDVDRILNILDAL